MFDIASTLSRFDCGVPDRRSRDVTYEAPAACGPIRSATFKPI